MNGISTLNQTLLRNPDVFAGNTDNAPGFPSLGTEWTEFPQDDASNLGSHTVNINMMEVTGTLVTLTVTDEAGNMSQCMTMVDLQDTIRPTVTCVDTTLFLDVDGVAELGIFERIMDPMDNCGVNLESFDFIELFGCDNVGTPIETPIFIPDVNGNTSIPCISTVTVLDTFSGLQCQDVTISLGTDGEVELTAADLTVDRDGGCENPVTGVIDTMISISTLACSDIGMNEVTVTVTVDGAVSETCIANVIITDDFAPAITCPTEEIEVFLDADGAGSLTIDSLTGLFTATDNCAVDTVLINNQVFSCADTVGSTTIELDLFFSEYIEGSSNNKCLEIFNGTGADVDLSTYTIQVFNNGATGPNNMETLDMSGTLLAGDVYVICNGQAADSFLIESDITSTVTFYNGDDAIVLLNGTDTIDIFGSVGEDPGSSWNVNGNSTGEMTLVRNPDVISGNRNNTPGFPSLGTEWMSFPQNTSSFLGSHVFTPGAGEQTGNSVTLTAVDENGNEGSCTFTVTVSDTIAPVITCVDSTVYIDVNGMGGIVVADLVTLTDNCPIDRFDIVNANPPVAFDCSALGEQVFSQNFTDLAGNAASCDVTVTVLDTISPVVTVNNPINLTLDANGNASVSLDDIVISATDNCTADEDLLIELNRSLNFTGADIPTTIATLSVTDESGNVTEVEITFNINFLSPPVACITDINVTLDADCSATVIPSMVISGGAGNLNFLQLEVVVQDADGLDDVINGCGRFIYTVTDLAAPGSTFDLEDFTGCWGYVNAEDKTSPEVVALPTAPAELFCSELDGVNINTLASTISRCYNVNADGDSLKPNFLQSALGRRSLPVVVYRPSPTAVPTSKSVLTT